MVLRLVSELFHCLLMLFGSGLGSIFKAVQYAY